MQSRWGDDIDEELQHEDKKIKVGFVFNYMQMSGLLKRIEEETKEWDAKYPKSELMKIWGCDMLFLLILFTLAYGPLIVATGLPIFFYGHILIQISGVYKRFQYSRAAYWGLTLCALAAAFFAGYFLRGLIFG